MNTPKNCPGHEALTAKGHNDTAESDSLQSRIADAVEAVIPTSLEKELAELTSRPIEELTSPKRQRIVELADDILEGRFKVISYEQLLTVAHLLARVADINFKNFDEELILEVIYKLGALTSAEGMEIDAADLDKLMRITQVQLKFALSLQGQVIEGINIDEEVISEIIARRKFLRQLQ